MSRSEKSRVLGGKTSAGIAEEAPAKNGKRGSALLNVRPSRRKKRPNVEAPARRILSPESVSEHARATFGSVEKAQHWMNRPNPLFQGKTPLEVMQTDPVGVEAELVRIDHGVYV
jgi:uncharacterized protein (DUF2384 family)